VPPRPPPQLCTKVEREIKHSIKTEIIFNNCIVDEIFLQNLSKSPAEPQGCADHSLNTTGLESGRLVGRLSSAQLGCNNVLSFAAQQ
jgi:hypothetical protein